MSEWQRLTEDDKAALLAWATEHPRVRAVLTAGKLADLHEVVGGILARREAGE